MAAKKSAFRLNLTRLILSQELYRLAVTSKDNQYGV